MNAPQPAPMLALPNYSSLGSLVTPDMGWHDAASALREAGWSYAGDGAETEVYAAPSGDRVIKLLCGSFTGNEATINAALEHPDNPHLPHVYGMLALEDGLAVETEVLKRAHSGVARTFRRTSRISTFGEYGQPPVRRTRSVLNLMPKGPLKDAVKALERSALDFEEETGNRYLWDLHGGNFMVRPSTGELVLNDTIYVDF